MKVHSENYHLPFPKRLRMLMDEYGVNQQELADFVGVKRQTVAQWKDGKTTPDIYNFQKIAEFFKLPYAYLMGDTESREPKNMLISEELGLSDTAISILLAIKNNKFKGRAEAEKYAPLSEITNFILEDMGFVQVLQHIQDAILELWHEKDRDIDLEKNMQGEIKKAKDILQQLGMTVLEPEDMSDYHMERAMQLFRHIVVDMPLYKVGDHTDPFDETLEAWEEEETEEDM